MTKVGVRTLYSNGGIYIPGRKPPMGVFRNPYLKINRGIVGDWMMWEGAGPTVEDLSGNGNTGTLTGTVPSWTSGKHGSGILFPGTDEYISTTGDIDLDYVTIIASVKSNSSTGSRFIVNKNFSDSVIPFSLCITPHDSYGGMAYYQSGWKNTDDITDIRNTGRYHHVAGTYDGVRLNYYIDGVLDVSSLEGSGVLPKNNAVVDIGVYRNDNVYFDGIIEYVMIFNRALSASEIALLYRELFCGFRWDSIEQLAAYYEVAVGMAGAMTTNTGYWGW
jgi:hypothetical protein